ncbi:MAG: ribonuclease HII [Candidatus Omnitrophota bacterium]
MPRKPSRHLTKRLLYHERKLRSRGYSRIAGVDEAGRGPLAGPVVAASVILKTFTFNEIIFDSKKLSPARRERAYREILDKSHVGVGIVDEKTIDRINIFNATRSAMELSIADLGIVPDYVMIDGTMQIIVEAPRRCIKRGDTLSMSIAAASIVAKVTRDRLMVEYDRKYPQYGFSKHKGYGTKRHLEALRVHGPCLIHRLTFRGTT